MYSTYVINQYIRENSPLCVLVDFNCLKILVGKYNLRVGKNINLKLKNKIFLIKIQWKYEWKINYFT